MFFPWELWSGLQAASELVAAADRTGGASSSSYSSQWSSSVDGHVARGAAGAVMRNDGSGRRGLAYVEDGRQRELFELARGDSAWRRIHGDGRRALLPPAQATSPHRAIAAPGPQENVIMLPMPPRFPNTRRTTASPHNDVMLPMPPRFPQTRRTTASPHDDVMLPMPPSLSLALALAPSRRPPVVRGGQ